MDALDQLDRLVKAVADGNTRIADCGMRAREFEVPRFRLEGRCHWLSFVMRIARSEGRYFVLSTKYGERI